jgi:hypothetical protein
VQAIDTGAEAYLLASVAPVEPNERDLGSYAVVAIDRGI